MTPLLADLGSLWPTGDPAVRVVDARIELEPFWPAWVLLFLLGLAVFAAIAAYGGRRVDLDRRHRVILGALRALALAVPLLILARPHVALRLERATDRKTLFLLDGSASMSLEDSDQESIADRGRSSPAGPAGADGAATRTSRWRRAVAALGSILATGELPSVEVLIFDEEPRAIEPSDLAPGLALPGGRTALGEALEAARARLSGAPSPAVIVLSDGADNASGPGRSPREVARSLARAGIPVHACLVGNERPRDLAVAARVDAPYALGGDPVGVRVRLDHVGLEGAVATVTVRDGADTVAEREVSVPQGAGSVELLLHCVLRGAGRRSVQVHATLPGGDLVPSNDLATVEVFLLDERLRVLYVEKLPRWQYRFLSSALRRDQRIEPTIVLLSEGADAPEGERSTGVFPSAEEIPRFDAIAIGDVGPQDLSPEEWKAIVDHVVRGGAGLVVMAGAEHDPRELDQVLGSVLPFERALAAPEREGSFRPRPTALGREHPLTSLVAGDDPERTWAQLPPLDWLSPVRDLKPGAAVLVEAPLDPGGAPEPLLVLQRVGRGTVVFVGTDETWKWRYQAGNRFFWGFWGKVLRHVGMPRRARVRDPVRISAPEGAPAPASTIPVTVSIEASPGGVDDTADGASPTTDAAGRIALVARRIDGAAAGAGAVDLPEPLRFLLDRAADGSVWHAPVSFPAEGSYRLTIEGLERAGERTVTARAPTDLEAELDLPAARPALLREIAAIAGGEAISLPQLPELVSRLDRSPIRERWSERKPLWDGWVVLAALAIVLCAEWTIRKWRHLP